MKVAIIACVKQEELYIQEWLDWHFSIGVDHIYLADNNDYDYPVKLSSIIQDNRVTILNYNEVHPVQVPCYNDIFQEFGDLYDWVAFIDIDEFIHLPFNDNNLKQYLENVPSHIFKIGINWKRYGDNGLIYYEDKPVQERFTQPVNIISKGRPFIYKGQSCTVKSIIRGKKYYKSNDVQIVSQHFATNNLRYGEAFMYDVLFNKVWNSTNATLYQEKIYEDFWYYSELYNTCYIRHFQTKTIEEYIKYKLNRGSSVWGEESEHFPYGIKMFFSFNEKTKEKLDYIKSLK